MIKAIDLANFTDIPSPEQVQCLKDKGYTRAFVGSSFGNRWQQQIAALEAGGFVVGEYMFPTRVHDTDREWWLDVEQSPGTDVTQQTVRAAILDATNKPRGIYSNRTAWIDCIGFDWQIKQEFPWLQVWDANYGFPPRPFITFGGFSIADRVLSQWAGSVSLCNGLNVDLNEMEDEMTEADWKRMADIIRAEVLKAIGTVPDGNGEIYKQNMGQIEKLQLELFRQELEQAGQLPPRH